MGEIEFKDEVIFLERIIMLVFKLRKFIYLFFYSIFRDEYIEFGMEKFLLKNA